MSRQQAYRAIERYDLVRNAEIVHQLDATHAAFQVSAGENLYVLRQFNPYMDVGDLRIQFRLARLIQDAGLGTPTPMAAQNGEAFVEIENRIWALFPWCSGRSGRSNHLGDLSILASKQGEWVACCECIRSNPQWESIIRSAAKFRRRKSWAWIMPLDQVPRFAMDHMVFQKARSEVPEGPHSSIFLALLSEVYASICKFEDLLKKHGIHDMPHTVTHGDFWASNIVVSDDEAAVLDLYCYSFEPRVTDFARAANWYYRDWNELQNACLFRQFQEHAQITKEEAEALPMMMCAHDLYYAIGHILLFLEEDSDAQARLITSIQSEMKSPERYESEKDKILRMFLKHA
jgi:Ser/Thr protein kinase RdoA (MazF antagonist)